MTWSPWSASEWNRAHDRHPGQVRAHRVAPRPASGGRPRSPGRLPRGDLLRHRGPHQRPAHDPGRHQQLHGRDLRAGVPGGRRGRGPQARHRHDRLADRQRHLRRAQGSRAGPGALHGPREGDRLLDRIPGQSGHDRRPGRAQGRHPARRRFALQHLRRLPAQRRHPGALPAQRPGRPRQAAGAPRRPGRKPPGDHRGNLLHARRPRAGGRVRRGQAQARRLPVGRRGPFPRSHGAERARRRGRRGGRRSGRLLCRDLQQESRLDRRLRRLEPPPLRHPARLQPPLHVHRLALAGQRRGGPGGPQGPGARARAPRPAVEQRPGDLRRADQDRLRDLRADEPDHRGPPARRAQRGLRLEPAPRARRLRQPRAAAGHAGRRLSPALQRLRCPHARAGGGLL